MKNGHSRAQRGSGPMSELGQKRRVERRPITSGLPPGHSQRPSACLKGAMNRLMQRSEWQRYSSENLGGKLSQINRTWNMMRHLLVASC